MKENGNESGQPDDIKDLEETFKALSPSCRKHLLKVARLSAPGDLESGDTLLSKLLDRRPAGKRYQQYERAIRRAQRASRNRSNRE